MLKELHSIMVTITEGLGNIWTTDRCNKKLEKNNEELHMKSHNIVLGFSPYEYI